MLIAWDLNEWRNPFTYSNIVNVPIIFSTLRTTKWYSLRITACRMLTSFQFTNVQCNGTNVNAMSMYQFTFTTSHVRNLHHMWHDHQSVEFWIFKCTATIGTCLFVSHRFDAPSFELFEMSCQTNWRYIFRPPQIYLVHLNHNSNNKYFIWHFSWCNYVHAKSDKPTWTLRFVWKFIVCQRLSSVINAAHFGFVLNDKIT